MAIVTAAAVTGPFSTPVKAAENARPVILIIGASRGLGLALAEEFLKKGWNVVGTVRCEHTALHELAAPNPGRIEIAHVDVTSPEQIAARRQRLAGRSFAMLFHNAGTADANQDQTIAQVSTEQFERIMVTSALGSLRVIEALHDLVPPDGLIGVMSSGQGSISANENGGHEVYRGSKAALNMYMRSYAARHAGDPRPMVLMASGWVRTDLGGPKARLAIEDSIPKVVNVLLAQRGKPGLRVLDREGSTVAW
ncbi:NAD(P)-dependent dehydrogenase, short-chain alcohol dehydrogenase family [Bosea sp. CRIB-10]|uniref:SDR family oxidoreductase n=1 Tax=Bosea sp. CRIB-10 TaxID=378404 RepID=UPI0008F20557|nr:SDR family oxidoreductase [Bosea sp. CRIB-10]SFD54467.1 NAD(P)-dependent dehydrogenase, short-chain alcohol dehydrogenase family [Bosea sp. CRIB-10]